MAEGTPQLPTGPRLMLIVIFACVSLLLQALVSIFHHFLKQGRQHRLTGEKDLTIVSTAIPAISDEFNTTEDVGWYGSAYFLTMCSFQIFWGRLYTFFDLKKTYIASIVIFEIGSLVCAVAPSSAAFIVGRALTGIGGGGVFAGSFVTIAFSVPLVKRPIYASYLGAVYGVASVLGYVPDTPPFLQ